MLVIVLTRVLHDRAALNDVSWDFVIVGEDLNVGVAAANTSDDEPWA
jgi:hypothetical protein